MMLGLEARQLWTYTLDGRLVDRLNLPDSMQRGTCQSMWLSMERPFGVLWRASRAFSFAFG